MRKTILTASAAALTLAANPRAFDNAGAAAKPATPRVEPVLTGAFKIDMPERQSKRGSESKYPFDTLTEIGQAFGVKNKTASQLSSIVSNANRKALVEVKDAAGNTLYETKELTGADGTKTVVPDTSKPKTEATKHFFAHDVDAAMKAKIKGTPLEGSTVLVFRDK